MSNIWYIIGLIAAGVIIGLLLKRSPGGIKKYDKQLEEDIHSDSDSGLADRVNRWYNRRK